jgi:UDP-3-O-[3-hydroxymyristoyl] glucosamine N-acyltransferase
VQFGTPAEDASLKKRELVWIRRIPDLWKKIMENK